MSTTPSTRGRPNQANTDTPENQPPQTPETGDGMPDDETRLRRLLSRIGVRPLGHAEQPVEEEPEPGAARPDQDLESAGSTRRISMSPGGRLPVPGQTIDLTDEQQTPADEPMPAEDQDATADPEPAGESANSTWPPRVPWRRRKDDDQAEGTEGPAAADADEDLPGPEGEGPDWFRVRKTADPQAPDQNPYEVHNHYYGTGQEPSVPAGEGTGPAGRGRNRSSLTAWWASLTPLQRFILHNGAAATAGAWSWGVFTAQWNTGLPQWTLAVMHDAAASSNEPSTPFIVGGGVILIVTLIYGIWGKGKKKLARGPAQAIGFFAELAFLRAGSWPHDLGTAVQDIPRQIAANPDLGPIGMTAVVIILLVLSAFAPIVTFTGALWGMLTAAAMSAAQGSIWRAVIAVATAGLSLVGA